MKLDKEEEIFYFMVFCFGKPIQGYDDFQLETLPAKQRP